MRSSSSLRRASSAPAPFAVAFGAQAQIVEFDGPLQTLIRRGLGQFGGRDRRDRRRRDHLVAQFFLGQLGVEGGLAGDALPLRARFGRAPFALVRAPEPVDPGRIRTQGRWHRLNRGAHGFPVAATQRHARLPLHLEVAQGRAIRTVPIRVRFGRQHDRGGQRHIGPADRAFFGRQLGAVLFEASHGQAQRGARHAAHGDQVQLALGAAVANPARHRHGGQIDCLGGPGFG
jgi:hypothetical protein